MTGTRVLLVDDEPEFTDALAERMRTRGLDVDVSASGEDALRVANQNIYDAVVLDLAMPGMDGIETLKRMVRNNPDIQVILLTGHATLQSGIEAMKSGALDFLTKPVKIDDLMAKIEQARENRERITEQRIEETLTDIMRRRPW